MKGKPSGFPLHLKSKPLVERLKSRTLAKRGFRFLGSLAENPTVGRLFRQADDCNEALQPFFLFGGEYL
ncbi:MAG: hypothetical protein J1F60_06285, partial [Oscillospiraceae bacterium]|nr:hypothetical protein [Oscillospiraceae bacterium]